MAKRGQNEGSIYKRADGRWCATLSLGYSDGKRRRKSFYGETRKDVQLQLTAALRDHQRGLPVPVGKQTVAQFLEHWLETSVKPPAKAYNTHRSYAKLVRLYLIPHLGRIPLQQLGPQQVQAMMTALLTTGGKDKTGVSPRTVAYARAVLRRALNQAIRWHVLAQNAAGLTDPPTQRTTEVQPFDPDEARAFLAAVKGHRQEALYTVALALGLRQGEALGLRWEDIDLDGQQLHVRKQIQRIEGTLQLVDVKTPKSKRTIPLPITTVVALMAHRTRQAEERLFSGQHWREHGLVFPTMRGTPQDGNNVRVLFQRLVKGAGLPHQRFHDLRHACASLLIAQNVHPRIVMEILGHSNISITMNTYGHVLSQAQRDAVDSLDKLLNVAS